MTDDAPDAESDGTPDVVPVEGCDGVYRVDTALFGPGFMSAYVVSGEADPRSDGGTGTDGPDPDAPVAVVDPGPASGADRVLAAVEDLGLRERVAHVVPTHVHLDHAGAAGALAAAFPEATVHCHEAGREYLTDGDALARLVDSARRAVGEGVVAAYGDPEAVPPERCEPLSGGGTIPLGDRTLSVVETPGHAPHQVGLLDDRDGALFAGDAAGTWLGGDLSPTTPPPDFDLDAWMDTLDRLRERDPEVVCYGHFGARTDAGAALSGYADLLPAWVDAVRAARESVGDGGSSSKGEAPGDAAGTDGAGGGGAAGSAEADTDDAATPDPARVVEALDDEWQTPTVTGDVAGVLRYLDEE